MTDSPNCQGIHHQSSGLLIQFILYELMKSDRALKKIGEVLACSSLEGRELEEVFSYLIELSGHTEKPARIFTWNLNEGGLAKLKNYASYFCVHLERGDPRLGDLRRYSHQLWFSSLELHDLLNEPIATGEVPPSVGEVLKKSMNQFRSVFPKFCTSVYRLLGEFSSDENVVWFIVRHRVDLEKVFSSRKLKKFFSKFFPRGKKDLRKFLVARYTERGFYELVPEIEKRLVNR